MTYHVSRNGQTYGPYTQDDLRRYLASGNILPTDLVQAEGATGFVPIQQVLGTAPPPLPAPSHLYATPLYPDPPDLNWGLVILLTLVTNGIFLIVWEFIVAAWLKKVQPTTKALSQYILGYCLLLGGIVLFIIGAIVAAATNQFQANTYPTSFGFVAFFILAGLIYLAAAVLLIIVRFTERTSLEAHFNGPEPIGLRLSPVMTFFFGTLYFQYHLNRINQAKQLARYTLNRPQ